ncbi:FecR family protein, partial [Escherichia coli]|nr:FecR family protein [Escherichia coli]
NKEVEHYKYTGKFRQSRGVINALRLLQKDAPFTIEQDEDKQIIYIK